MADVFISYKREDRPLVERLAGALEQLGFEVWWDFDLLSGESFRQVIRAVIDRCRAVIVVWSRASAQSDFVLDEASYALRLGRLCPVCIEAVELPFGFGQRHVDDLSDWSGELSHPGFRALVNALEERVGRKARLGAAAPEQGRQAAAAELEAFKAAQLAATTGALRTFVAHFSGSVFAPFVRDQIETMEKDEASRVRPGSGAAATAALPEAAPAGDGPKRARRLFGATVVAGAVVAGAAVGAGVLLYQEAGRRAQEERAAEQRRAADLQAQASAERAARERAEQRSEALQLQAGQERQAREQAARLEAERKRRDSSFSIDLLHADLRATVVAARRNALEAESAAIRARTAASLAEAAAERARAKLPGTISLKLVVGTYEGEGGGNIRNGYGVVTHHAPSNFDGDRFAGQYKDDLRSGLGVYTFGTNADNKSQKLRREGEYVSNLPNGLGTVLWVSGERHAGHWKNGQCSGPGVRTYADGRRYEGDYVADRRSGLGVLWSANGLVASAGIWKDGKLVTALAH